MAYVDGLCTGTIGTSAGAGISVGWKDEDDGKRMGFLLLSLCHRRMMDRKKLNVPPEIV